MFNRANIKILSELTEIKWDNATRNLIASKERYAWLVPQIVKVKDKYKYYEFFYLSKGKKVKGYFAENSINMSKSPLVIYNRGGTKEIGQISFIDLLSPNAFQHFLCKGYSVISTQYSGNEGSEGKDEYGGQDLDDILELENVFRKYNNIDQKNIFMYGGSRGGTMVYMALREVDWIKGAAVLAGVTNLERQMKDRQEMKERLATMFNINDPKEVEKRSPIKWADKLTKKTPILILHGTKDDRVNPMDSYEMGIELLKKNVPHSLIMYKDADHALAPYRREAMERVTDWFNSLKT